MGAIANLPLGLAPGLGINAYVRDFNKRVNVDVDNHDTRLVRIFCGWVSRKWHFKIWRSFGGSIYGGVRLVSSS